MPCSFRSSIARKPTQLTTFSLLFEAELIPGFEDNCCGRHQQIYSPAAESKAAPFR